MDKRLPRQQIITKMAPEAGLFMTWRCKLQIEQVRESKMIKRACDGRVSSGPVPCVELEVGL